MHSPAHRANIMNGNYTEIGIATAHGVYKGREVVFVVQEFGRPSLVAREVAPAPQPISLQTQEIITPKIVLGTTPSPKMILPKTQTPEKRSVVRAVPPQISTTTTIATPKPTQVSTTTIVAGAETTKLDTPITLAPQAVNTAPQETSSKVDTLIASPRSVTTTIYLILAAMILFALGLAVFVKVRIQHPHLIANGVLLVAFTLSLIVLNAALGFTQGVI
jgi:hypothetical protein